MADRALVTMGILLLLFIQGSLGHAEDRSCQALLQTAPVPLVSFVKTLVKTGNIHKLVDQLETDFQQTNFRVSLGKRNLFILQDRDLVRSVMRKESKLPFVNRNFDASHGHFSSINSVNTTDPLWVDLHENLEEIFRTKSILPILDKYQSMLTASPTFNLNQVLADFYLTTWGEYCFGPLNNLDFQGTRDELVRVLGKVFHQNKFNRLPYLGAVTSRINRMRYGRELKNIDSRLETIVSSAIRHKQGAFYELYERLKPKYPNAFEITRDNSFLAVLVYDFIHIVMLDTLAHVAKKPDQNRQEIFVDSRHHAFLYPFRFRIVEDDYDGFKKGDFAVINLQKSKLYFSAGARLCPGARLFNDIAQWSLKIYSDYDLRLTNPDQDVVRSPNLDLPFMLSEHEVVLQRCPFPRRNSSDE